MTGSSHATVLPPHLRADCAACVGLCCVALPFDAAQGFGLDKPADTPCPHLCADFKCGIHDGLIEHGFLGCVVFDCHGAGQRVSQQLFPGQDWADSAHTARRMFDAFSAVRALHDLMALLYTAHDHTGDARLAQLSAEIEAACECMPVEPLRVGELRRMTHELLGDPAILHALQPLRDRRS